MHLLYLDESGEPNAEYFVLAGISVFERQTFWLTQALDSIQAEFLPNEPEPVHLRATDIRSGARSPWAQLPQAERYRLLDRTYGLIAESRSTLFGVAVEHRWLHEGDAYGFAFESIIKRFDDYLRRLYKQGDEPQRGLVIIAESQFRQRIETIARKIRHEGTKWGELYNIAEIPLFTPAPNSRLLQVADFCANAVWGRYERGLALQFDKIAGKFDAADGIIHGLGHFLTRRDQCLCPACLTRRLQPL